MIVSEVMPSPDCHDDPTNQHGTGFLSCRHGCQLGIEGLVSKRLGSRLPVVTRLAQVQEPGGAGGRNVRRKRIGAGDRFRLGGSFRGAGPVATT